MSVTITTLVDNTPGEHDGLRSEHGLSFYIETPAHALLFDTGQSKAFFDNASVLNLPVLDRITHVVLSHNHYDHTGGLSTLIQNTHNPLHIHVGQGFFTPKYALNGPSRMYLGSSFTREELITSGQHVHEHRDDLEAILPDVYLITNFPRNVDTAWKNPRFVIPEGDSYVTDSFSDEISVVIRTPKGLVLLVGCSHPGILNIISSVQQRFKEPLYAVLGGTHLVEAQGHRLDQAIGFFKQMDRTLLGMSHCTGDYGMKRLQEVCSNYYHNHTGDSLIISCS